MMNTDQTSKAVLSARAEASAWITQLHGPNRTREMEEGFQRWLRERPENREEFEGLTEIWDLVGAGAAARGVPRLERWEHSAEAQELKALREKRRKPARPAMTRWASAALVLVALGILAHRLWLDGSFATGIGEQRIAQLEDGTRVSLNSNSRLVVDFDRRERRIKLEQGEALFEVAKDSSRPFTVVAGDNRVTALGTSFLVRMEGERTAITLVDGKISVSSPNLRSAGQSHSMLLSAGQRITLQTRSTPTVDKPALEAIVAWRRGEVVLNDTPLSEAVLEMNRYDKTRIVIDNPEIEGLLVSGLYHTGDSEGFARSVVKIYRLRMVERDGQIRLER